MRKLTRILAVIALAGTLLTWALLGGRLGWSQTAIPTKKVDPITEIEFTEYESRFVPGVDFLGAGIAGGVALFAFSFLFRKTQSK